MILDKMKVYIETFGCTFNQGDSQIMAGLLQENDALLVETPEDSDVIIINTCYVKLPTEQRVLNRIHKVRQEFPGKKLIIAGCMVEIDPEKLEKAAPGAGWIGPHHIKSTADVVESCFSGEFTRIIGHGNDIKSGLPKMRTNPLVNIIQICEGCDGICSYCCTRIARGKLQSYPVEDIKQEAEQAVSEGCVELQLTAQDTAAYGKDTGTPLSELINAVTDVKGKYRVRVGMMHPKSVLDNVYELIHAFKSENVYNFIHLPLQSGNDDILADMNRGHSVDDFKDIVSSFRREIPEISLSTDIIVGYPTETPEAFQDTLKVIEDIKPDFLHISKYYHRPGAASSILPEIEHQEMKERTRKLNQLKSNIALEKNQKLLGKNLEVLITGKGSKGGYIGRTNSYKTVVVQDAPIGKFVFAKIIDAKSTYLTGKLKP